MPASWPTPLSRWAACCRGDRVAIFGIGGLRQLAQQYAQVFGGETIAIDVTEENRALARQLGAPHVVDASTTDPVAAIEALGGADVAVVLAADLRAVEQAFASLRSGGRLILMSLPEDATMSLPVINTLVKGIRVISSGAHRQAGMAPADGARDGPPRRPQPSFATPSGSPPDDVRRAAPVRHGSEPPCPRVRAPD